MFRGRPSVSLNFKKLQMGIFGFSQKETGAKCLFLLRGSSQVQCLKNTASIIMEISKRKMLFFTVK